MYSMDDFGEVRFYTCNLFYLHKVLTTPVMAASPRYLKDLMEEISKEIQEYVVSYTVNMLF